jgi:hypothetical protein
MQNQTQLIKVEMAQHITGLAAEALALDDRYYPISLAGRTLAAGSFLGVADVLPAAAASPIIVVCAVPGIINPIADAAPRVASPCMCDQHTVTALTTKPILFLLSLRR